MTNQRYVSKELTHFVGRKKQTQDQQFRILVEIISSSCLKSPLRKCDDPSTLYNHQLGVIHYKDRVCFCDIPVGDLQIHTRKYSNFGIAFKKEFLISKGANPVFYIVEQSGTLPGTADRVLDLDDVVNKVGWFAHQDPEMTRAIRDRLILIRSFCKLFQPGLPDDHLDNYYMERGWRLFGNLKFQLDDVNRIILPKNYAKPLRDKLPNYLGQITFLDDD